MIRTVRRLGRPYYYAAKPIYERWRLKLAVQRTSPLRLVIGAGGYFEAGWLPTDIHLLNVLKPTDWQFYFRPGMIDALLAEHVWEHLTLDEGIAAARQAYTYLKPGGYFRVAVPDGLHSDPAYIAYVKPGGTGNGAYDHKILYSYRTLSDAFSQAGFTVTLLEYFDDDHHFHFTDWEPTTEKILRSRRFDHRNQDGALRYTSLIVDATKPQNAPASRLPGP